MRRPPKSFYKALMKSRNFLVFALHEDNKVGWMPHSTSDSEQEDVRSIIKFHLSLRFRPVPKVEDYLLLQWDNLEPLLPERKLSTLRKSGIVLLMPRMPAPVLKQTALKVKEWALQNGEILQEISSHNQQLAIFEAMREDKIEWR